MPFLVQFHANKYFENITHWAFSLIISLKFNYNCHYSVTILNPTFPVAAFFLH